MTNDDSTDRILGTSFRGRSLVGADFSGRDVRGADFIGADLRGADFTDATFGVAPRTGIVLLGVAMLVAVAAGVAIGWVVDEIRVQVYADAWDEAAAGISLIFLLLAFVGLIVWRGFDLAVKVIAVLYVVVVGGNIIANLIVEEVEWFRALRATWLLLVLFLAILAGILGRVIGGVFGSWSIALVAILGGLASGRAHGGVAGIIVAVSLVAISKRAVRGDARDRSLRRMVRRLVGRWGTRFDDADLSGADFTGVDVSGCTVVGATVVDVIWDPDGQLPLDLPDDARPAGR
jgi:hypothetical protein